MTSFVHPPASLDLITSSGSPPVRRAIDDVCMSHEIFVLTDRVWSPRSMLLAALEASLVAVESGKNLKVLWPPGGFFGADHIFEVGDHDLYAANADLMSSQRELAESFLEATWTKRNVELTMRTDQVRDGLSSERPAVVIEGQTPVDGRGTYTGTQLLERRRQAIEILDGSVGSQVNVPAGRNRGSLGNCRKRSDDDVVDAVTVQHFDDGSRVESGLAVRTHGSVTRSACRQAAIWRFRRLRSL